MSYCEYLPHKYLQNYIDAYWTIKTDEVTKPFTHRILPDGCTDIIFNKGNAIHNPGHQKILLSGESYLVGTMTTFSETIRSAENSLLGIRFKPGGMAAFYRLNLYEITDLAISYKDYELRGIVYQSKNLIKDLNLYFLKKLPLQPLAVAAVITEINTRKGSINVAELIRICPMSERKLERLFKKDVGVSVKGLIRLIRFTHAAQAIRNNSSGHNLAQIAYSTGYYDQAHLCNEIKGFTGLTPSKL